MFSLYDTIAAAKTARDYSEILKEKIFEPFSMNDASTGFQPFKDNNNKALPHTGSDKNFRVTSLNDRYYNTLPAAGNKRQHFRYGQLSAFPDGRFAGKLE
jgi:CubicO group peptidase (beta-lactamase class C family)